MTETTPIIQIKIFVQVYNEDANQMAERINKFMRENIVIDIKMHAVHDTVQYTVVYQLREGETNDV